MTVNVKQRFKDLENKVEAYSSKKDNEVKDRLAKLEKQKKDVANIAYVLDKLFEKSSVNEFMSIQKDFAFERQPCFQNDKATWTFSLKKYYDKDADLILSVNEYFDIKLAVKEIPNPNYIFYIVDENDGYKFAKVPYKSTHMHNRYNSSYGTSHSFHIEYDFKRIDKEKIQWLSSIDDLVDLALIEVANYLEKELK
jgi:hypothetical protein